MTRCRPILAAIGLVAGLLVGAAGTQAAYWLDACVARESGGTGISPDWLNRCRH